MSCLGKSATIIHAAPPPSTQPTLYVVGTAHLDTQWLWTIQDSINEYVPNTLNNNFDRFEKFPDYKFSFEGAFRYMLAREYQPAAYEKLKSFIASGRWNVCGSSIDAGDVNLPSPEALVRLILYGNGFFQREFGHSSCDIYLPDCFGFGYALPTLAVHCGLKGFSTQKLTWGSSIGIPFDIGVWEGVDGSSLIAALNPGDYVSTIREDLSRSAEWLARINKTGHQSGAYVAYKYFGVGDQGGAPDADSVAWLEKSIHGGGPIRVISAAADQLYRDLTPEQIAKLPRYRGEMLMTRHGTGCYTSQAIMKRWNRRNEQLADAAERASAIADWLGGLAYPRDALRDAWLRLVWHHHHDDLTGTSIPQAYTYSWNDELACSNQFSGVLTDAVDAVSGSLDTRTSGIPIVIFNPLSIERQDVVDAIVRFPNAAPKAVSVKAPDGRDVPAQVVERHENDIRLLFLATAPSVGFAVFSVEASNAPAKLSNELRVSPTKLENARYRVAIDRNGDVSNIFDKSIGRELLVAPIRQQLLDDVPDQWPEWEISYKNISAKPRAYVAAPAKVRVVEDGPVRVAVEIVRQAEGSTFVQRIRLSAGGAGDRVEFDNRVDWNTRGTLLKAAFELASANPRATYDLGLGTIERGNNTERLYEVPAQQWADVTSPDGLFGVTIMNDCKYGWDKPDDRTLRLSLVHSPPSVMKDLVTHRFLYAVAGHKGDWRDGQSPWIAARVNQPLEVFRPEGDPNRPRNPDTAPALSSHSFASVNTPQVAIRAIKKSEEGNDLIVRVQELSGRPVKDAFVRFAARAVGARAINGSELPVDRTVDVHGNQINFDMKPYELQTFAVKLAEPGHALTAPTCRSIALPFDTDVVSRDSEKLGGSFDRDGHAIPAELLGKTVECGGIRFELGTSAPTEKNAMSCRGQTINLPGSDAKRLHVLAAADGDTSGSITLGERKIPWHVQNWTGDVGQWQSLVVDGRVVPPSRMTEPFIKRDRLAWIGTHRHDAAGRNEPYVFCYLYRYSFALPTGARAITLPDNERIRVFAVSTGADENDSFTAACDLYDYVLAAKIEPRQELAIQPFEVTIRADHPNARIHYTLDGSEPTQQSPTYSGPIKVSRDATIRAKAVVGVESNDFVTSRSYRFVKPLPAEKPGNLMNGLSYAYYEGSFSLAADLEKSSPMSRGTIDIFRRPPRARDANFGVQCNGYVDVPRDGVYTFYVNSDDGSNLWIGKTRVVDNDGLHGAQEAAGAIALAAGKHPIRLEYFQRGGDSALDVSFEGPEIARQPIAATALFRASD